MLALGFSAQFRRAFRLASYQNKLSAQSVAHVAVPSISPALRTFRVVISSELARQAASKLVPEWMVVLDTPATLTPVDALPCEYDAISSADYVDARLVAVDGRALPLQHVNVHKTMLRPRTVGEHNDVVRAFQRSR